MQSVKKSQLGPCTQAPLNYQIYKMQKCGKYQKNTKKNIKDEKTLKKYSMRRNLRKNNPMANLGASASLGRPGALIPQNPPLAPRPPPWRYPGGGGRDTSMHFRARARLDFHALPCALPVFLLKPIVFQQNDFHALPCAGPRELPCTSVRGPLGPPWGPQWTPLPQPAFAITAVFLGPCPPQPAPPACEHQNY